MVWNPTLFADNTASAFEQGIYLSSTKVEFFVDDERRWYVVVANWIYFFAKFITYYGKPMSQ